MIANKVIIIALSLLLPVSAFPAVIHVPQNQPTIQDGIVVAEPGDVILVSPGTYVENIDFLGKAITVISESGPEQTIIDGNQSGSVVLFQSGEDSTSVLRGFTLRNGSGTVIYGFPDGGGVCCFNSSSPTISGNIIIENSADNGAGIYMKDHSSPTISGNIIRNNLAIHNGVGVFMWDECNPLIMGNVISDNISDRGNGGGIYCGESSNAIIRENTISGNRADDGGGINCYLSSPRILDNTISGNTADMYGGITCYEGETTITGNIITDNTALSGVGGGIHCLYLPFMTISNNIIKGNSASGGGAGIVVVEAAPLISNNIIEGNRAQPWCGGGILCIDSTLTIKNNIISGNSAIGSRGYGGGIYCEYSTLYLSGNTITDNTATCEELWGGGGICCGLRVEATIVNSIFWNNQAPRGPEVYIGESSWPSTVTIDYSCVKGGEDAVYVDPGSTLVWGAAMIDSDPVFVSGPQSDHYLSQIASGQPADSPCVDAGDPTGEMPLGSTRTDHAWDSPVADIGYHHSTGVLVTGPGPAYDNPPTVRVFPPKPKADYELEFTAYGAPHYGVNVACGDLDGDITSEIITGAGPGAVFGPHVRGFRMSGDPVDGLNFLAYGTNKWGVNVCAGDIDGDGFDEIITGAGPGAAFGPHVRGWNYDGSSTVSAMGEVSYFAYGTPKWGVNVSAGDIDGDGYDEIVTGAGPGAVYGPHVRGWNVDGGPAVAMPGVSFLAYGTNRFGVNVASGDIDGDGIDEIVTGAGPGAVFGSHVRGWNVDGGTATAIANLSFFAWPSEIRYGANVFAGADLNGNGRDEIVVGCGPDPDVGTPVKVFLYDGVQVSEWLSLDAFETMSHGTNVAAGRF